MKRIVCIIIVSLITPFLATAVLGQDRFSFDNIHIGIGMNSSNVDLAIPEFPQYSNTGNRNSLMVGFRFNFLSVYNLRISPGLLFWSWGEFPAPGIKKVKTSIESLAINADVHFRFHPEKKLSPYFGAGPALQSLFITHTIPSTAQPNPLKISKIEENYLNPGANLIFGVDYKLSINYFLNMEIRKEFSKRVNQWKFIANISIF